MKPFASCHRQPTIALCMIVRDEERHLPRCLESVRGIADELIIVDTGSRDRTPQIAQAFGARLIHAPWQGDFAAARNAGLDLATAQWILILDADEELERDSRTRIRHALDAAKADAFSVRVRNLLPQEELCRYGDTAIVRVFRNDPSFRFEQPIHEQVIPSIRRQGGIIGTSDLTILHYGYAEDLVQSGMLRSQRNLGILHRALERSPNDPYLHYQLGCTYKTVGDHDRATNHLKRVLQLDYQSLGLTTLGSCTMRIAQLALSANQYGEAAQYAELSLRCNASNAISLFVAALAYIFMGRRDQARPYLREISEKHRANFTRDDELKALIAYCGEEAKGP